MYCWKYLRITFGHNLSASMFQQSEANCWDKVHKLGIIWPNERIGNVCIKLKIEVNIATHNSYKVIDIKRMWSKMEWINRQKDPKSHLSLEWDLKKT